MQVLCNSCDALCKAITQWLPFYRQLSLELIFKDNFKYIIRGNLVVQQNFTILTQQ